MAPLALACFPLLARAASPQASKTYRELDIFTRVLAHVENHYVDEVEGRPLVYGAIRGMIEALDPHSLFMPPDVFKEMKIDTSGEFGGLGIDVARRNELLIVVAPIDDTPAARAGLKAGDAIVKIDGEPAEGLDLASAIRKMRGPPGSKIVLTILREGFAEPRDIPIIRDRIHIVSVESKLIEGGYGYVKIKNFQERTDRYLKKALDGLREQGKGAIKGLILDLRNNPGGLLDQAVRVADAFLGKDQLIVSTKGRGGRLLEEERARDGDTEPGHPMIVLVNRGSASASEIVAGALQDHGRALLLGTETFGKGSVQTVIELEDGSGLKLTIARYHTPKGRAIQDQGLRPDVLVPEAPSPPLAAEGTPEKPLAEDAALKAALDYLRTFEIFQGALQQAPARPKGKVP